MTTAQLINAPASIPGRREIKQLGYLQARDAMANEDYAFVAYQQMESSGEWRVAIDGRNSGGAFFEPAAIRSMCRTVSAQGKTWFAWGHSVEPSENDPRSLEFRVHVKDGRPREIEMIVQLRQQDGSADTPVSTRFVWPSLDKPRAISPGLSLLPAALSMVAIFWQNIFRS